MKMIKLSDDHYVVVDESIQPVNGLYYDAFVNSIENTSEAEYGKSSHCWQITRSTQPIEEWKSVNYGGDGTIRKKIYNKIKPLSLSEVKELLGVVDVEKRVQSLENNFGYSTDDYYQGAEDGYNQALEDNKERKYTEDDLRKAIDMAQKESWDEGGYLGKEHEPDEIIQTLQPQTEWEVEFVDGKLKLI